MHFLLQTMDEIPRSSLPFFLISSLIIHSIAVAKDTISASQTIRDGETLVSSGGIFELGFFSPGNSTNRYVGIWYKNISVQTVVWVANRQASLTTKSGVLTFTDPGILALYNDTNGVVIWSSNTSSRSIANPSAQLLDSGNLVVKDAGGKLIWQSFDYPTNTFLPGMSLGWNFTTGVETYISSWKSDEDPAPGEYTIRFIPSGYPQLVFKKGEAIRFRIGPWTGLQFSGTPSTDHDPTFKLTFFIKKNEISYRYMATDPSTLARDTLTQNGVSHRWIWIPGTRSWTVYYYLPADACDGYNLCGAFGTCNFGNAPVCGCLDRFVPEDPQAWSRTDWSSGCVRRIPLNCRDDGFLRYSAIKLPDTQNSTFNEQSMSLEECEAECSRKCDCVAYTQLNASGAGSGCLFYYGELIDIRTMAQGGEYLYIRMASADLKNVAKSKRNKRVILIASSASAAGMVLVCMSLVLIHRLKRKKHHNLRKKGPFSGSHGNETELPFFNLSTLLKATDNFSVDNMLGQGGFGPVYRGKLEDGQQIAVKRLSETSLQGVDELKNEVILIAKLQHRNLVRILGCCIERKENMLVYEYMPNYSLDLILFDETKSMLLDWDKRFHIINGIAKGLLYLHQDSRLRIIHRDLKASNILLDGNMNPKISDFGLARGFGENETEAKTRRVVGTYGYMSPEYAIDGFFSVKSDVFSFGVLVLEVVSGIRNRGSSFNDHNLNLLGHAWTLYKEDKSCELVDASLGNSFDLSQVLRSIHVGLLCVQKRAEDRPNMSSVVFMLGNEVQLPQAKQPGFFTERDGFADQSSSSSNATNSVNQITITIPYKGR